jgi:hypothetical protein
VNYIDVARIAALQESNALRGYARAHHPVPKHRPIDMWDEYDRLRHRTDVTDTLAAA